MPASSVVELLAVNNHSLTRHGRAQASGSDAVLRTALPGHDEISYNGAFWWPHFPAKF
jgi:hypothetical protein